MQRKVLQILAIVFVAGPLVGSAQGPKDGIYFTAEDIQAVLKHAADTKRTIPDNTIQVLDMGKYNLGVAVVHRGALAGRGAGAGGGTPPRRAILSRRVASRVPAQRAPAASTTTTRPRVIS